MSQPKTITIDGVKYVRADEAKEKAGTIDGLEKVIVRSYGAGVFFGYLKEQKAELNGVNITLINARRIYYWAGACSLSQLAVDGSKDIVNCKISVPVGKQFIANCIEILPLTLKADKNLSGAIEWKK